MAAVSGISPLPADDPFRIFSGDAPSIIYLMDERGGCTFLNARWTELTGQTEVEALGHGWRNCIHPDDRAAIEERCGRAACAGAICEEEYRVRSVNGVWRWVIDTARPRTGADGVFRGHIGSVTDITARRRVEEALSESEAHYRNTIDLSPHIPFTASPDGKILLVGPRWLEATGMAREDALEHGWVAALHPEDVVLTQETWQTSLRTGEPCSVEYRLRMADGTHRWHHARVAPRRDETGQIVRWYGTLEDIDDRRLAEAAVREKEEFARSILSSSPDCIKVLGLDGALVYMNGPGLCAMEIVDFEPLRGRQWSGLWPELQRPAIESALEQARAGGTARLTAVCPTARGTPKWWDVSVSPILDAQGRVARLLSISRDVTERVEFERERLEAQARVAFVARHDALTGLPNRTLFHEHLSMALFQARRRQQVAVLCLDLDQFKAVNDTYGHAAGDDLLRQVAERIRGCVRGTDTVTRLGGDEFAIVQTGVEQPQDAARLAERVVESLAKPFDLGGGQQVFIGTSIGIAIAPKDGVTEGELLQAADIALYRAKADGRGLHRFYEAGMDERIRQRQALTTELHGALSRGELQVVYQPLIDIATERTVGMEALLRWQHPERGLISPSEFIPLAEENGLIVPIGAWVLREACLAARTWPGSVVVSVNLSPVQFRKSGLVGSVQDVLATSGLSPERLELEITESVLLQDCKANLEVLGALRALGVRIVMDDFGTGYSSLSYLRSFPFDKVKIDRSFITDLPSDKQSQAIVRAVAGLCRTLDIKVLAEGVETRQQLDALRSRGCQQAQGYLFGRPVPASETLAVLERDHPVSRSTAQAS